jgi:hypothetical protein
MSAIVKSELRNPGFLPRSDERTMDTLYMTLRPGIPENELTRARSFAQSVEDRLIHRDSMRFSAFRPLDINDAVFEIDIPPSKPEDFSSSESRIQRDRDREDGKRSGFARALKELLSFESVEDRTLPSRLSVKMILSDDGIRPEKELLLPRDREDMRETAQLSIDRRAFDRFLPILSISLDIFSRYLREELIAEMRKEILQTRFVTLPDSAFLLDEL